MHLLPRVIAIVIGRHMILSTINSSKTGPRFLHPCLVGALGLNNNVVRVDADQAGPKYLDSGIDSRIALKDDSDSDSDSGIDSWIDSIYKQPSNKPVIQLSQPSN